MNEGEWGNILSGECFKPQPTLLFTAVSFQICKGCII